LPRRLTESAMRFQVALVGAGIDVVGPSSGVVHSSFARALNMLVDGEMWTVLGADRAASPFSIGLAAGSGRFGANVGDRVNVRAGYVGIGRITLDCRSAARWTLRSWSRPVTDGLAIRLANVEDLARPRAWDRSVEMACEVTNALLREDAVLNRAVRRTLGRGPGLTPAGDDVLVGILSLLTSGAAGLAGKEATSRLVEILAPILHETTDVSRHLLHQAARGLTGRALHELGQALLQDAPHNVLMDAIERVLDIGCTSGADACVGLIAACRFVFFDCIGAAA
jgi:hypothetical protein